MPSQSLHEEQGRHNEALRKSLPDTHPDWEITVMFYAALHYLRAALATRGDRYTGRDLRYDLLTVWLEVEGMGALSEPFDTLWTLSYKTRYECKGPRGPIAR